MRSKTCTWQLACAGAAARCSKNLSARPVCSSCAAVLLSSLGPGRGRPVAYATQCLSSSCSCAAVVLEMHVEPIQQGVCQPLRHPFGLQVCLQQQQQQQPMFSPQSCFCNPDFRGANAPESGGAAEFKHVTRAKHMCEGVAAWLQGQELAVQNRQRALMRPCWLCHGLWLCTRLCDWLCATARPTILPPPLWYSSAGVSGGMQPHHMPMQLTKASLGPWLGVLQEWQAGRQTGRRGKDMTLAAG